MQIYITSIFEDGRAEWTAAFPTFKEAKEETLIRLFDTVRYESYMATPKGYKLSEWKKWCRGGDQFSLNVFEGYDSTHYNIHNEACSLGSTFMRLDAIITCVEAKANAPLWVVSAVDGICPKVPVVYSSKEEADTAAKDFALSQFQKKYISAPKSYDVSLWKTWAKKMGAIFTRMESDIPSPNMCILEGLPIIRYNVFDKLHRKDVAITQCELEELPF